MTASVLGYDKLTKNLHGRACVWYESDAQKYQHRMILWPRGHYKSTVFTVSESLQSILPDDNNYRSWPECLGPNIRIAIYHAIETKAISFLQTIQQHVLSNIDLLTLFPEILPDTSKQRVNRFQLELPRTKVWPEPTITAAGRGGASQGGHYNKLKLDDIIGEAERDSPTEMMRANQWFDNHSSLFSSFNDDICDIIGTRWAFNDTYDHAMKAYGDKMAKYIQGFYTKDENGNSVPIFPEQFDDKKVDVLKKNRKVWTAQYLNDPKEIQDGFNSEWLRYYYFTGPRAIAFKDEYGAGLLGITHLTADELDICFLIDPAPKGEYGFIITGMDRRGKIFVLEAIKQLMKPDIFVNLMFQKVIFWRPRVVGIEFVNFSEVYEPWFQREMSARQIYFRIQGLRTRNKMKEERIRGLMPYYSNGLIYHNERHTDLGIEYDEFGATSSTHLLDALAHGPQVWRKYDGTKPDLGDNSNDYDAQNRDKISGYSKVSYA